MTHIKNHGYNEFLTFILIGVLNVGTSITVNLHYNQEINLSGVILTINILIMTAINRTDTLYVTALSSGVTLLSTSLRGAESMGDVLRHVKSQAEMTKGVVTLRIRNSTQGWVQQHNVVLNTQAKPNMSAGFYASTGQGQRKSYPSLFD